MASPAAMTAYERRRLENVKRNEQMFAYLNLQNQAADLTAAAKRRPKPEMKSYKNSPGQKKPKPSSPVVIRRSLRSRGLPPDAGVDDGLRSLRLRGLPPDPLPSQLPAKTLSPPSIDMSGALSLDEARVTGADGRFLVDAIMGMSESAPLVVPSGVEGGGSFELESMVLKEEDIARILPSRIYAVRFFPSSDRTAVVAGDMLGNVGFWDVDFAAEEGNGIYTYSPHSAAVSEVVIHPFSLHKIFTSSYDGRLRLLDVGEQRFDLVHSFDDAIFSFSQLQHDPQTLLLGEGQGGFSIWDLRAGKISCSALLHSRRINSIDCSPSNTNLIATSSTDGLACIWDLRIIHSRNPENLKVVEHKQTVQSAFFSPSGNYLATTSADNHVGLVSGVDFANIQMINHYNQTGTLISTFRAIWGWDDSCVFIGSSGRAVDVMSTASKRTIRLESEYMTAIPYRFAAHPCKVGMLAGTTWGGQVYIWTQR